MTTPARNPNDNTSTGSGIRYLVLVCLVATLGGLLFGYDTAVISGAIGFLQQHFELDAAMKGWAASSALVGCFVGVAFAGEISDRLGRSDRADHLGGAVPRVGHRHGAARRPSPSSSSTASSAASAWASPR